MKDRIRDDEFEKRNNLFNVRIEEAKENFEEGVSDGMADTNLDRIEVQKTDKRNVVQLIVYLKVVDGSMSFLAKRKRGSETSFCFL